MGSSGAAKREPESRTDLPHSCGAQARDASHKTLLRHGDRIVQVHGAPALHSVVHLQLHFRGNVPDCGSNRGHRNRREMADSGVAGEYENRSLSAGRSEPAKVNIAAVQSSGQAATPSQGRYSSTCCG